MDRPPAACRRPLFWRALLQAAFWSPRPGSVDCRRSLARLWRGLCGGNGALRVVTAAVRLRDLARFSRNRGRFAHHLRVRPHYLRRFCEPVGAVLLLGGTSGTAYAAQAAATIGAGLLVAVVWRRQLALPIRAATLAAATLMAIPVVLLYDLILAAVSAAWLIRDENGLAPWKSSCWPDCSSCPSIRAASRRCRMFRLRRCSPRRSCCSRPCAGCAPRSPRRVTPRPESRGRGEITLPARALARTRPASRFRSARPFSRPVRRGGRRCRRPSAGGQ